MSSHSREFLPFAARYAPPADRRIRRAPARAATLGATLGVLVAAACAVLQAQQARQRVMYVTATDSNGAPVAGLTPDDLVVREDGARREVLRVEPATSPIEITLVVDTSAAGEPYIADMRRALRAFVADMAKGNEIGVTTIGGRPQVVQTYTANVELLNRAVGRLFADQTTGAYLLEALSSIAPGVVKRAPERAVIIAIIVQAGAEFSSESYEPLVKALNECGAAFNAIVLTPQGALAAAERSRANHDRDVVLDLATRGTGGVNVQALSGMALDPELKSLAAQLRGQYRVVYARPEALIPPQKIEVSARKAGVTVRGTPSRPQRSGNDRD